MSDSKEVVLRFRFCVNFCMNSEIILLIKRISFRYSDLLGVVSEKQATIQDVQVSRSDSKEAQV